MRHPNKFLNSGFTALFVVIVVGAAAFIMAYSASFLGLGELELGYTSQRGSEAFSVADGCMEETLRRVRLNTNYGVGIGTINLTVSNGSCTIDVTDPGGSQRRIVVTGRTDNYNKKIQAEVSLSGNVIILNSWQELSS